MLIRLVEGEGLSRQWVSLDEISPHLPAAVIASEDNLFCRHYGFDWQAIQTVIAEHRSGDGALRGASTISMQTSKNLFLWPARGWLRKALEAYLTVQLELLWPKRRVLEVYLNIAEWGGGIYGAEAAAQHYFGKPASDLTAREAALMAVTLPSPRSRSPAAPSAAMAQRSQTIAGRVDDIRPLLDCL